MSQPNIIVYGADWCPDCRRSKSFLKEKNISFTWIDVDQDQAAEALVREKNNGNRVIPTIIFEDGSFLSEPSNEDLANKIGVPV
ncbi:MAG: glutaredoxin domain-containing protein [Anaerolineales bacterium]